MTTLGERTTDLITSTDITNIQLSQFLTDSAQDILNILPDQCLWLVIDESASIAVNGYALDTCKVISVTRDGEYCTLSPSAYEHRIANVPDSLFAGSATYPTYILKEGKLSVYPSGFTGFKVEKISYPNVSYADTSIGVVEKTGVTVVTGGTFTKTSHLLSVGDTITLESWTADVGGADLDELNGLRSQVATVAGNDFTLEGVTSVSEVATGSFVKGVQYPKELEHIVVLGACIKGRITQIALKRADIPPAPGAYNITSAPNLSAIDTAIETNISTFSYNTASAPIAPGTPVFSYSKPTITLDSAPVIANLDVQATPPVPPSAPTIAYADASNSDGSASSVSTVTMADPAAIASVDDISLGQPPTYNRPNVTVDSIPTITDLDLSTITVPSLDVDGISYTAASGGDASGGDASATESGTSTVGGINALGDAVFGALPAAPLYIGPSQDISTELSAIDTFLSSGVEDTELAGSKISQVGNIIAKYQADLVNQLNSFNGSNAEYQGELKKLLAEFDDKVRQNHKSIDIEIQRVLKQADIDQQKALQDAKSLTEVDLRNKAQVQALSITNKAQEQQLNLENKKQELSSKIEQARHKVNVYQSDVGKYQQEVSATVQSYVTNEVQKELESWNRYNMVKLDKYSKDIQNELNAFNKENVEYQSKMIKETEEIKVHLARVQADLQSDVVKKQKDAEIASAQSQQDAQLETQADLANKAQDQILDLQNKGKDLEALIADWNSDLQLFQQDLQKYQIQINAEIQEYTVNEIQKEIVLWQQEQTHKLQQYGQDIQNEATAYKQTVDEYTAKSGKFQAETQKYSMEIQENTLKYKVNLDKFASELNQLTSINQNIIADNGVAVQKWSQENTLQVSNYTAKAQEYQIEVARHTQEHGLMTQELQQIQGLYQSSLQNFISKYAPPPTGAEQGQA